MDRACLQQVVAICDRAGAWLLWGSAMGMEGYRRIGYANTPEVLAEGLEVFRRWLADD